MIYTHAHAHAQEGWPLTLKNFIELSSGRLSLDRRVPKWVQGTAVEVERSIQRGMTPKKLHEVCISVLLDRRLVLSPSLYFCLSVCPSVSQSVCLSVCLSVYLFVCLMD